MLRVAWLLAVLGLSGPLQAQTVSVRSGEHGGFTRMVFDIPGDTNWTIEQAGDRKLLFRLDGVVPSYDTSSAFDRIGRDRILDLYRNDAGDLEVALACACRFDSFALNGSMVVLDVYDADEMDPGYSPAPVVLPLLPATGQTTGLAAGPLEGLPQILDDVLEEQTGVVPDLDRATATISADIARAVAEGVLDPGQPITATVAQTVSPSSAGPPISVTSSLDTPAKDVMLVRDAQRREDVITLSGANCARDEQLDINGWGLERDISEALGEGFARLYGEFDQPDTDAAIELAQSLLHFGLGAEARSLLFLTSGAPDPLLLGMSYVVDGGVDETGYFNGMADCETSAALWAFLGAEGKEAEPGVNPDLIVRYFVGLPRALRAHLGVRLANRFTDTGHPDVAATVLNRVGSVAGRDAPEVLFGEALAAAASGDAKEALETLTPLSRSGADVASRAAARVAELSHEQGATIDGAVRETIAAFAAEKRHSDEGPALWRANILALMDSGAFDDARSALAHRSGVSDEDAEQTSNDFWQKLSRDANDILFLKHTIPGARSMASGLRSDTRTMVASRLTQSRFPEAALSWIEGDSALMRSDGGRLLRAQALLQMNRPEEAELLVIGLRDDSALKLRAAARAAMKDHGFAARTYRDIGEEKQAALAVWMADERPGAESLSPLPFADAAHDLLSLRSVELPTLPSLEAAGTVYHNSQDARKAVTKILRATELSFD